jgi:hypothetical protein
MVAKRKNAQAPKAVKRGGLRAPRASNGANARPAISAKMPRPFMRISRNGDVTVIEGMELLDSIVTSQAPKRRTFLLNAGNTQFFKRLSAHALAAEKFRFTDTHLEFWTQSPTSRSGIISAVIILDPLAVPPNDPQGYMAFEEALTGPISMDRASKTHRVKDPKWYYVATDSSTSNGTDPTTRYQGSVTWQSQAASSSDAGLLAGYIGMHYRCELLGARPVRPTVLTVTGTKSQSFVGASGSNANTVEFADVPAAIGSYDCDPLSKAAPVAGYTTSGAGTTLSNSLLSFLTKRMINYYLPIGAATVDGEEKKNAPGFAWRPPVLLQKGRKGWTMEVGGAVVDMVPLWATVLERADDEEKSGVLMHPISLSTLKLDRNYILAPNAAGDVTVYLTVKSAAGADTNVASTLHSAGTGALTLRGSFNTEDLTSMEAGDRLQLRVQPVSGETRAASSSVSPLLNYSDASGSEELF